MNLKFDFDEIESQLKVSTNRMEKTFDEQHPDAKEWDSILYNGSELIWCDPGKCWHCGKQTHWVDINFEAHLCSPSCEDAKWDEYNQALPVNYD